jgi:hypothetical protein
MRNKLWHIVDVRDTTMDETTTTRRTFSPEEALSTFVVPLTAGPTISCWKLVQCNIVSTGHDKIYPKNFDIKYSIV